MQKPITILPFVDENAQEILGRRQNQVVWCPFVDTRVKAKTEHRDEITKSFAVSWQNKR